MSKNVLTRKQLRAVAALLTERTLVGAASSVGISVRQLSRWLTQPVFRVELDRAGKAVVEDVLRRLMAGKDAALDTLQDLIASSVSESVRRAAAENWLDFLYRAYELKTFDERLEKLEEEAVKWAGFFKD